MMLPVILLVFGMVTSPYSLEHESICFMRIMLEWFFLLALGTAPDDAWAARRFVFCDSEVLEGLWMSPKLRWLRWWWRRSFVVGFLYCEGV